MSENKLNITVIGYTPASINTYVDIIQRLKENGYNVKELLLHKYGQNIWNVDYTDVEGWSETKARDFLVENLKGSDLVLYSLEGGTFDRQVPEICKELGIYSLGNIFTFWEDDVNVLHNRFKGREKPDGIVVTTSYYKKMLEDTVRSELFVWGNPHTDRLLEAKALLDKEPIKKDTLHFFSQPNGDGGCEPTFEECKEMITQFEQLKDEGYLKKIEVYIHPREDDSWYRSKGYEPKRAKDFVDSMSSEYIASVSSTMLYEGLVLGKKGFKYSNNLVDRFKNKDYDSFGVILGGSLDNWIKGIENLPIKK